MASQSEDATGVVALARAYGLAGMSSVPEHENAGAALSPSGHVTSLTIETTGAEGIVILASLEARIGPCAGEFAGPVMAIRKSAQGEARNFACTAELSAIVGNGLDLAPCVRAYVTEVDPTTCSFEGGGAYAFSTMETRCALPSLPAEWTMALAQATNGPLLTLLEPSPRAHASPATSAPVHGRPAATPKIAGPPKTAATKTQQPEAETSTQRLAEKLQAAGVAVVVKVSPLGGEIVERIKK